MSNDTVAQLDESVALPQYDFANVATGHVHIGVGAFMRAFIGPCSDAAMAAQGGDWGIAGVSVRSATVREQLASQDCLYTLNVFENEEVSRQLVGAIRSVLVAPEDPARVIELIGSPNVRIVTLTVTEKGYCIAPDSGDLDRSNADLRHDLQNPAEPRSTIGILAAGLRRRLDKDAGPLAIVSCDNLPDNGKRLQSAVTEFVDEVDPSLGDWVAGHVRFPSTMVDRIAPATTPEDIKRNERESGVRDEGMVKTEPFFQWVIEDDFSTDRPYWEAGGAQFVGDVEPYETAKLRLLNGTHSSIAYLGYLAGYELVSDAIRDPEFAAFARLLMTREISPVTPEPAGMEHGPYIDNLLRRFANASLRHRTWQIAMDGSQKLPQRLLNTVRLQLRRGGPIAGLTLAIAAWIRYALGRDEAGNSIDVRDPLSETFDRFARIECTDPEDRVTQFTSLEQVFGTDLASDRRFASTLAGQYRQLVDLGAAGAVSEYVSGSGSG